VPGRRERPCAEPVRRPESLGVAVAVTAAATTNMAGTASVAGIVNRAL